MPTSEPEKPTKAAKSATQDESSAFLSRYNRRTTVLPLSAASLPGPEVVTKVWESIKTHKLQNPQNKREIMADEKLQAVFGGKNKVSMFEMNKHLAQHLF